ncbi:TolB family protein [Streptosporangium sp. NPDC001559]|uniref:TolB family protein n=1 Tax=Streptosporangium sp. NPDC001559 TaxID=3366187 RepID=UPI0036E0486D
MSDRTPVTRRRPSARLAVALIACCTTGVAVAPPAHAAYPGVNGRVYYVQDSDLYSVEADGTDPVRLTATSDVESDPRVSADGHTVAFLRGSASTGPADVYVMNADGTGVTQVAPGLAATRGGLDVSPDGTRVVYTSGGAIKAVDTDGTDPATLVASGGGPAYSPDGTEIAYTYNRDIYRVKIDGTGLTQLTANPHGGPFHSSGSPDWSPDGTRLVYRQDQLGPPPGLMVMNADGTGKTLLHSGSLKAVWSPDGAGIAYQYSGRLFTMAPDGSNMTLRYVPPSSIQLSDWSAVPTP